MSGLITFILAFSFVFADEGTAKKTQLEELFIWKLSDELKLGPSEEKKFADLVRSLNQKKLEGTLKIEQITKEFLTAKSDKEKEAILKNLKQVYRNYNSLSLSELDEMKRLLGIQRLATYLEVKQELTAKVKSLLIQRKDEPQKKYLPPPKIIEEK